MKTIKFLFVISVLLLAPLTSRSQSNITIEAGTIVEIQTGADVCADTRTINGILTGNGTWCLIPLTPAAPLPFSPANLSTGLNLSLNLVWQRSLGSVTYRIQLSTDSLFTALLLNDSTVIDSVKAVAGLAPLTYYWWRVSAKGIGGTSAYSSVYKFRTLGYPNPLSLINPPNNAVNQPVSIQFRWSRASEQSSPFDNSGILLEKKNLPPFSNTDGIDAISNYWFDMVTDTVTLANLTRDTLLTDTTKSVVGLNNNISYYWRVKAKNQIGWGNYSVWYKFTTIMAAPAPPVLVSPLNNAVGQNLSLTLVWNKSLTATNYRVQLATDSLFAGLIVNDSTLTDSTRVVSGLTPLTNYWWRVNAKNIGGTGTYSSVYKFRTLGSPVQVTLLNPPNNVTNQPLSIQFRWSRASEQSSPFTGLLDDIKTPGKQSDELDAISNYWFDMVTDTSTLANLTRDTVLTDTTKSVAGLSNSTNYFWRVKAKNQIGWGNYSVWWKFTTVIAAPPPPVLVSPLNNAAGQNLSLTLVWNKSVTAANYRVQLATDSLFAGLIVNDSTLTDSIRVVSGLNPLTNYWWRVNAKNIGGTGTYSTVYKFRTLGSPVQVTLLNPPNNATNQPLSIQFRWSKASEQTSPFAGLLGDIKKSGNVTGAIDEMDAISNYWFDMVTDTSTLANLTRDTLLTDTTKSIAGLSNSTNYFWRVRAKNQIGWGNYSVWWKFTTIISAPPPPVLVSPLNNAVGQNLSLTLVWNKSLTATNYRVQLATDSLFAGLIVNDSTLTDSTRVVSGLNPLTNYWWRVNAKNVNGNGVYSTTWKFRTIGSPTQVTLLNPPNNATGQPVSINFRWTRASDQLSPLGKIGKSPTKTNLIEKSDKDEEFISNYWWELTTDTVSFANLQRDTILTDTTKTATVNYVTTYFWRAKAKNQIGWGAFSVWFRFTTSPLPPALVNLTVIPGGFYDTGTNRLNMKDTIRVYLVDSVTCLMVDSSKVVVDSVNFSMPLSFGNAATGNYYMLVYHRNHLGLATRFKQSVVRGSTVSYNFTTDSAKAFGFNMIKVSTSPVRWGMIPGDANKDGFIDAIDQFTWVAQNGLDGYLAADFNGDGFVDAIDQALWVTFNGLSSFMPCGFTLDPGTMNLIQNAPDYDAKKSNKIMFERKNQDNKSKKDSGE